MGDSRTWRKSSYSNGGTGACVEVSWHKSSYSNGNANGACVEVALGLEAVAVRDSKNVGGPMITVPPTAWASFVARTR